jgi:hypothetical protein
MTNDKKTKTSSVEKPTVPFFSRKANRVPLTVRTAVRAGASEQKRK